MYVVKPIVVNNSKIPDYFENKLMNNTVYGIMLFPFIFISPKKKINESASYTYDQIIMHETIHFYQCIETFFFGFYIIYAFELLCNLLKHWDLWNAYLSVRFEVEAYSNMTTNKYLEKRAWYDWTSYMLFPDDTYNIEDLIDLHQLHPDKENSIVIESTRLKEEAVSDKSNILEESSKDSKPVVEESLDSKPGVEESEPMVEESLDSKPVAEESEPMVEESLDEPMVEESLDEPMVEESLDEPMVEESLDEPLEDSEPIVEESLDEPLEDSEPIVEESLDDSEPSTIETYTVTSLTSEDVFNNSPENIDEEVSVSINRSLRNRTRKTQISID
jgi:hypothetical protein